MRCVVQQAYCVLSFVYSKPKHGIPVRTEERHMLSTMWPIIMITHGIITEASIAAGRQSRYTMRSLLAADMRYLIWFNLKLGLI